MANTQIDTEKLPEKEGSGAPGSLPKADPANVDAARQQAAPQVTTTYPFEAGYQGGWGSMVMASGTAAVTRIGNGLWEVNIKGTKFEKFGEKGTPMGQKVIIQIEADGTVFQMKQTGVDQNGRPVYEKMDPKHPLGKIVYLDNDFNPLKDFDYRKADLHHGTTMEIGDQYCIMGRGCRPVEMAIIAAVPGLQEIMFFPRSALLQARGKTGSSRQEFFVAFFHRFR